MSYVQLCELTIKNFDFAHNECINNNNEKLQANEAALQLHTA